MKKDFIPATKDMLQQAAAGELVLFAPARRHTAKLHAFTWAVAPKQANRSCAAGLVPIAPTLAKELLCFPDAQLKSYLAVDPTDCPPSHPWKDHYWVLDEPQTITREQIQGVIPANAPAAKGKAVTVTIPGGDDKPWLVAHPNDPAPDFDWYTPARYFARQLVKDDSTLLVKKSKLAEKTAASLASVGVFKRGKKKLSLSAGTVLKSFVNVMLS